jgi:hypothetical protein
MAMNSIEFYNFDKGAIGKLSYYKKIPIQLTDKQKENNLNKLTGNYLNMLIHKKSFGENVDLNNAFEFSRKNAKIDLNHAEYEVKLITINYQIKNKECYKELIEIEKDSNFMIWANEDLIERIKNNHNE